MNGRSSKAKGSRVEREIAAIMGGRRTPMSGAFGDALAADVTFDRDHLFAPLHVEVKARAMIPAYVTAAYAQARAACSSLKAPAVVIKQDRGRPFVFMDLEEFVTFTTALAEMGQGHKVKTLARDARRILEEIERSA